MPYLTQILVINAAVAIAACVTMFAVFAYQISKLVSDSAGNRGQARVSGRARRALWSFIAAISLAVIAQAITDAASEKLFLGDADASQSGHMSSGFAEEQYAAKNGMDCSHVTRSDIRPVLAHQIASSSPKGVCGISPRTLYHTGLFPFVKIGDEYRIRVGSWPFHYELSSTSN